jgi:hypothetical protein
MKDPFNAFAAKSFMELRTPSGNPSLRGRLKLLMMFCIK